MSKNHKKRKVNTKIELELMNLINLDELIKSDLNDSILIYLYYFYIKNLM